MYLKKQKNGWALFLLLLAGIVIGGAIGEWLGTQPYLQWLRYGFTFGIEQPIILNLKVITLTLGIGMKLTIAGLVGMILAIFVYRKL
ncbi:MAG: DUF4321 domain-containing protein [Epulopiscium sp.]|nr:DUF4321 domain-containing protein [Candidatus Epulonipiscium sp.]